jgi:hypothetical protein
MPWPGVAPQSLKDGAGQYGKTASVRSNYACSASSGSRIPVIFNRPSAKANFSRQCARPGVFASRLVFNH